MKVYIDYNTTNKKEKCSICKRTVINYYDINYRLIHVFICLDCEHIFMYGKKPTYLYNQ